MTGGGLSVQLANFEKVVIHRDAELAETVLHPEYALVLVQPALVVMPRARWLEVLPDYLVTDYEVEAAHLDVLDRYATQLQRVRMTATVLGADRSGLFVISDVWLWEGGEWRVWRRHSTPLAAGAMPGSS